MIITQSDIVAGSVIFVVLLLGYVVKIGWLGSRTPNDDADIEVLTWRKTRLVVRARESNKVVVDCLKKGLSFEYGNARRSRIRLMKEARDLESIIRKIRSERPFPENKIDA